MCSSDLFKPENCNSIGCYVPFFSYCYGEISFYWRCHENARNTVGGKKTGKILEYRFIPMMICSVKIGEELSAAALTRGLGMPVKRTNICEIGFHKADIFFNLLCLIMLGLNILRMIGIF